MKYLGSKRRIANELIPIIMRGRKANQWYVEPFVGGANMIDKVPNPRIGFDKNKYLIALLECIRDNPEKLPRDSKEFTRSDYRRIKAQYKKGIVPENLYYLVGFAGFCLSFSSVWFRGSRYVDTNTDIVESSYHSALHQSRFLKGCLFGVHDYRGLAFRDKSIIYCDPIYKSAIPRDYGIRSFNHSLFYQWCRDRAKEGHKVYISEYEMPDDFKCIWEKRLRVTVRGYAKTRLYRTEKLFVPSVG